MNNLPGTIIIEGHVQGLSNTRSLGEANIPVYIVDKTDCIARHSKYCKKFFICPDFQSDGFADFLINLAEKEAIRGWVLIPSNDHAVYTIAKYKEKLEKHYKVITPVLSIIDNIYDKIRLIDIAKQNNIPTPVTQIFHTLNDPVDNLEFPVITKGRQGLSFYKALRQKAFLAENETALRQQLQTIAAKHSLSNAFTQELIPNNGNNKTLSFTAFCEKGEIKTYWMGVKLREHPLQFGTATFAKSVNVEECYRLSIPLLKALNYTGVCEVEYLYDPRDNHYKLIEMNPRTWLWVGLAKACGIDYAKMIYDYVNGSAIVWPKSYKTDIYWINPFSDFVYAIIAMIKLKHNPFEYIRSVLYYKKVDALCYPEDNRPVFSYLTSIFTFLKQR